MSSSRGEMDAESAKKGLDDPKNQLPAVMARNEKTVREGFWKKMTRVAGKVPFAEEAAAAWFCARDPETPTRVRATLLAALAYFVMPVDFIPDIIAAFGFTDDATVLMAALGLVSSYMKPRHRKAAREALGLPPAKDEE
ncbi:YkvA family protein [Parvibaculum sp.]|uniref:YkvA family protein n=1 Tax=Parvibaculum sp. TaxID=2024848 RepID=UPI003BAA7E20